MSSWLDTAPKYLRETRLLVVRGMRMVPRVPARLADVTVQPVVFTVLFLYVFGAAVDVPGMRYQDYLLPGVLGQNLAFGVIGAGVATATDFNSGVVDRFRSLPVTRLSIVTAQIVGQVLEQLLGIAIVASLGLVLGWRPDMSVTSVLQLLGLVVFGSIALTSFGVWLGMAVPNPDAIQGIGFGIVFPLWFLAGTFVPIDQMASVPQSIARWDPMSAFVAALRSVCAGTNATGSWQLENPVLAMVLWCLLLIVVFVPLAVRRFNRGLAR